MRRRILIIVNPAAGRVRSETLLMRTVAALGRLGCDVAVRYAGEHGGGLEELAREAPPECDAVIAAGGDGTVDGVLNGLAASPHGLNVPFGLLPLGTVNLVAREIGLPRDPERLAAAIASGPVRQAWPGCIGKRLFLVVASCGFDADTVAAVDPVLKARLGRLAFATALLKTLRLGRRRALSLSIDGREERAAGVIVAKGRYYAGPFTIARDAAIAEPVLHAAMFRSCGRIAVLSCLAAGLCGLVSRLPQVEIRQCSGLTISGPDDVPVQADGEIVGRLPLTIGVAARPIGLIWP